MGKDVKEDSGVKLLVKRFLPYYKDYKKEFLIAIVGMLFAAIGTTGVAYIIKPLMDYIFIAKNEDLLYVIPFGLIFIYLMKSGGRYIQVVYTAYIGQDIVRRLRDNLLGNILKLDIDFFNKSRSGELISRNTNDIEKIRFVVANMIPEIMREALIIIVLTGYIFYLNSGLAFYTVVVMPLALYPLTVLAKKMKKIAHGTQEKISDITARLSEIFNNIEIIKIYTSEKFELKRFGIDNIKFFKLSVKAVKTNELVSPLMETIGALAAAIVMIVGGREVINNEMSAGSFFSFLYALFMLYTPLKRISKLFNGLQEAVAASERIYSVINLNPEIKCGDKKLIDINKIEFRDVGLKYGDKEALKGINFEGVVGQKVALVGDSGGGKSSIVNLIVRFYDVTNGEVLIDGENIKNFSVESLRKKISMVTQRIYILNDTVAQNVAYGNKVDEEKIVDALKKANAYDFVKDLKKGIHTNLDEFGVNLSGGQRQRIAIARAIYTNPPILILDEATSALDTKSEQLINEAIKEVTKDKLTFIIAHRLSTIKEADKIIVLKSGKIESIGTDEELFKNCQEYRKLKSSQKI